MKKLFLIIIAVFLLAGCRSETEVVTTDATEEVATPVDDVKTSVITDNTLTIPMRHTQTLNPLLNKDKTVNSALLLMFEPLIKIDAANKPTANIAESWTFSEDGLTLTIKLKNGVYWHDGSEITSDDIIFSLNTIRGAGDDTYYKKVVQNIVSYSTVDRQTARITFSSSYSGNIFYMNFPLISSSYYRNENVYTSDKNLNPLGNGKYTFESFTPAKELRMTAVANSFSPMPSIKNIEAIVIPDKDTDLFSFDQGIIDCVAADETEMGRYDNARDTSQYEYSTNNYDFIGVNFYNTILQDKYVRKAIAYSLPKQNILESVYLNHADIVEAPVSKSSWLYEEDTVKYEYDSSRAKELLGFDGWVDSDGDGIRERVQDDGKILLSLRILACSESEERRQIAVRLADELSVNGFDIALELVDYNTYIEKINTGDFDLFVGGWSISPINDLTFMFGSQGNIISYANEDMDAMLADCRNAIGEASTTRSYSRLQKYIADELPYISIAFRKSALFAATEINGIENPNGNNIYEGIEYWKIMN